MLTPPPGWVYPAAVLASVLVGVAVFVWAARASGISARAALALEVGLVTAGLLGARLHMLLEADRPWGWSDVLQPGFRHPGGIVAVIAVFPLLRRLLLPRTPIGLVADCAAISATCALAMVRLGCFAAGCCFGTVSNLPWAVRFPIGSLAANLHSSMGWLAPGATASLPVHPLQLYFAVLAAGVGAFLVWFRRRRAYDGQLFLLFLAVHEIGKYLLEFLRAPGITPTGSHVQAFSLLLGVAGATALLAVALARATSPIAARLYGGPESSAGPRPSDARV